MTNNAKKTIIVRRAIHWVLLMSALALLANTAEATNAPAKTCSNNDVMQLLIPRTNNSDISAIAERIYQAAEKQAHYLLTTVHPWQEDPNLLLLTESKSREHWIRPNTCTIGGFSFLYRFGPYDEKLVGLSRSELLKNKILPMMRYIITTHRTGPRPTSDGKKWGHQWQSAHWAHMIGRAAWWLWDDLPDDIRDGIRRVVADEADRIANTQPPHRIEVDTKSEENAFNSQILSVAVILMPNDSRRQLWEDAFHKWAFSAYLRPADKNSNTIVDGIPVSERFTGANIHDDFTLENHRIVHPDYMTAFILSLGCTLDYLMTDRTPPEALLYNIPQIYENLKWFSLPDVGFVYPSGQDWRLFRNADWIYTHALMAAFTKDPEAWSMTVRNLEVLEKMQARSDLGAIYQDGEYRFASTQHHLLYHLSLSWLALQTADNIKLQPADRTGIRRLDSGKIIINRTKTAIHTFSWGRKIMAQCVPFRADRIVSPHQRNAIGHVRIKGHNDILEINVHNVNVTNGTDWFAAELVLDHGKEKIRAHLNYKSNADGTFEISEKLVALTDLTTTEIATGLIGILNNTNWIYEQGQRHIAIDDQKTTIGSLSGKIIDRDAAKKIVVDSVLQITSKKPLHLRYAAATEPHRARVTDELYLNYIPGPQNWHAGDIISQFEVTIRCLESKSP